MGNDYWTDVELAAAVQAYLFLLSSQVQEVDVDKSAVIRKLLATSLSKRNRAAVRYRFRNISFVFANKGWVSLKGYTPASQVGKGVEAKIVQLLSKYPLEVLNQFQSNSSMLYGDDIRKSLSLQLNQLDEVIESILENHYLRGHNNPPELIENENLPIDLLKEVQLLTKELQAASKNQELKPLHISNVDNKRKEFRNWLTARITKFIDAALYAAAPIMLIKLFGVSELLTKIVGTLKIIL